MPRISYVNGQYLYHHRAAVHIEDRGYQFADAVYEVIAVIGGRLIDEVPHFERLERSLREIRMAMPFSRTLFLMKIGELLRLNRLRNGSLYIQISRGVAPRNHQLPAGTDPGVVMTVRPLRRPAPDLVENGVSVISVPDIRWKRPDIKSVSLLPNVLARDEAVRAGAFEAWQVDDDGTVTEGTSTNAWIVSGDRLVTHPPDHRILNGVTRLALIAMARDLGLSIEERPFSLGEAQAADEAFLTSTTSFILPVVRLDGAPVGAGIPGPRTRELAERYDAYLWRGV